MLGLALAGAPWSTACAQEQILDFQSEIKVLRSGNMQVRESIKVRVAGKPRRHGIYRDFPTVYQDHAGNRYHVRFDVAQVLRDGYIQAYHFRPHNNGVRIYIGEKDRRVAPGIHTYTLVYETNRQIGFFHNHDELYWNVTGNGWSFPIEQAGARISLPTEVSASSIHVEGYTGPYGAKGQDYRTSVGPDGMVRIATTRPLAPHEGLTVLISWPKGFVHEPKGRERVLQILADNIDLLAALIGLSCVLGYYCLVCRAVSKDPGAGVIFPMYKPPAGYSPASMRFISRMGYDDKTFTAAVLNLAVKGLIHISETKGVYTLTRTDKRTDRRVVDVAPGEGVVLRKLFAGEKTIVLENNHYKRINRAISAHKQALKDDFERRFFLTNTRWLIPGVLLSVLALVLSAALTPSHFAPLVTVAMILASLWTLGVVNIVWDAITAWQTARRGGYVAPIAATAFAIPFLVVELTGLGALAYFGSTGLAVALPLAVAINLGFYQWLKRSTLAGRKMLDKIEGFRLYLDVAEVDEDKVAYPVKKMPQLFEAYLPYAVALDIERRWAARFASMFSALATRGKTYRPVWYRGVHWNSYEIGGFTTAVGGALSAAISSAATPPGSSPGSSGGNVSGGGKGR